MKRCWEFLDLTSRSFAAVIHELDGDLSRVVRVVFLYNRLATLTPSARRWPSFTSSCAASTQSKTT